MGAAKVTDIDMTGATSLKSIGEKAFYTAHGVTGITIPEGVTAIGANAFAGTSGLKRVDFPSTVTKFGTGTIGDLFCFSNGGARSHQSIMDINIAAGNSLYRTDNGIVYSADGKKLVYCSHNKTDISIADGTKTIAAKAFYMTKAASVEIPGSVTDIEGYAFYSSSIKSLILNEGLETIGSDAFGECYANMEIVFPSTLTKINSGAFDSIGGKVTFLNKDTEMTSGAFATYKALEVVGYKDSTAEAMYKELAGERGGGSGYLFPFLSGTKNGHEEYLEYTAALSRFNRNLKTLKEVAGIASDVTSYTIRHSFAMALKEQNVPIEMISELLGHKSIKTTQIYLRSFSLEKMTVVNKSCFENVYNYMPEVG